MKRFGIAFLFSTLFVYFLFHVGCDKHPVTTPMPPPTFTPTYTPVLTTITISGSLYYSGGVTISAVTILAGGGVIWTNTDPAAHSLCISNVSGACSPEQIIGSNGSITIMFPTAGTCYAHCGFHNYTVCPFGSGICDATCEGSGSEAGRVVIQ